MRLFLVGAGGHGCVVAEAAREQGRWDEIAFLDDVRVAPLHEVGIHVAGRLEQFERIVDADDEFLVTVGDNARRVELVDRLRAWARVGVVLARSAVVSPSASIASGTVVMSAAVINAGSRVGEDCIVNTAATIDHGVVLERGVHVSPGVHLGGEVFLGARTWVGIGASISNGVRVGADIRVGAGAVVVGDLEEPGTYVGVPAAPLGR